MSLRSLTYREFNGTPNEWELKKIELGEVNLLVGKNATGKSRVLSVIANLSNILAGRLAEPFLSGSYAAEFDLVHGRYSLVLECNDQCVVREELKVNDVLVVLRGADGRGTIWYEAEQKSIQFELDPHQFALPSKRDELQHPFAAELAAWAVGAAIYYFGSDFGKTTLADVNALEASLSAGPGTTAQQAGVVGRYVEA